MNAYFHAILPLIGVVIGGILTYIFQSRLHKRQIEAEKERYLREKLIERLKLYGQVLKVDGEVMIVELAGGIKKTFNLKDYTMKIRPIIYENFYLVDETIRDSVNHLDNTIAGGRFFEDIDENTEDYLATIYLDIIDQIKVKFKYYQTKIIISE